MRYFRVEVGQCVDQVYEIEASSLEEAKAKVLFQMGKDDELVVFKDEVVADAITSNSKFKDFAHVDLSLSETFTMLVKGAWVFEEGNGEVWSEDAYWWTDDVETLFDKEGNEII